MLICVSLLLLLPALVAAQAVFDNVDQERLVAYVIGAAGAAGNFGSVRDARFAVAALQDLGVSVQQKDAVCALASSQLTSPSADTLSDTFHSVLLVSRLGCTLKVPEKAVGTLKSALTSNKLSELFAGIVGLHALKKASLIKDAPSFGGAVKSILALGGGEGTFRASPGAKEALALNAGLAFEAVALVGDADDRSAVLKELGKLLDVLESTESGGLAFRDAADESHSSLANLRATATVVSGLAELERAGARTTPALSDERLSKLARYFAEHKRVRSVAEAAALARGLVALSSGRAHRRPLVVTLADTSRTALTLTATDVLAEYVGDVSVVVRSLASESGDATPLFVDAKAKPSSSGASNTRYTLSFGDTAPACGRYTARVDVKPASGSDAVPALDVALPLTVLCELDVRDVKIETLAVANTAAGGAREQTLSATYPERVASPIALVAKQTLRVAFTVRDKSAPKRAVPLTQAFVRFAHAESARDAVFVARLVDIAAGSYVAEIYLDAKTVDALGRQSGAWRLELVLGDVCLAAPVNWQLGTLTLTFKSVPLPTPFQAHASLPLISHKFREPSRRPLALLSLAFAALAAMPLLALIAVLLPRAGASLAAFPTDGGGFVTAVAFHGLLALVLFIYALYFFELNMMQVLSYVGVLAVPLLLVGRELLSTLQRRRLRAEQ